MPQSCHSSWSVFFFSNDMFPVMQAFPEAAAFVLCFCQYAELSVCLAGHHLAHSAQPAARDPHRGLPQTPWTTCSAGSDKKKKKHTHKPMVTFPLCLTLFRFCRDGYICIFSKVELCHLICCLPQHVGKWHLRDIFAFRCNCLQKTNLLISWKCLGFYLRLVSLTCFALATFYWAP